MNILIDNKDLYSYYDIRCLDYTEALGIAPERVDEKIWIDKSGVDKNTENIRYDAFEFVLYCIVKASDINVARNKVKTLTTYMKTKGVFVLSLRDTDKGIRESFLCERSGAITPTINVREQNGLYVFKIGLKDVNPNALKYYNTVTSSETTINYTKGRTSNIYWGNGDSDKVSNSGDYTKNDYSEDGLIDIIVDVDAYDSDVDILSADFTADVTNGVKIQDVQFTDASVGNVVLWSWNITKDGETVYTSHEQNPLITFENEGVYTVTLQVFNAVTGYSIETKTDYITIVNSGLLINDSDYLLINGTDKLLIN